MTNPIAPAVLRRPAAARAAFRSDQPLPRFSVISEFLRRPVLQRALAACRAGEYSNFCGYVEDKSLRNEYCNPREGPVYVTVHQRPVRPILALDEFARLFGSPAARESLAAITGIDPGRCTDSVLTCWGPDSFLEPHTDHDRRTRLVLSISLTTEWHRTYGGSTVYAWNRAERAVRVWPKLNTAVLFVPFSGSWHWVEQIASSAPPQRRFTWTLLFR